MTALEHTICSLSDTEEEVITLMAAVRIMLRRIETELIRYAGAPPTHADASASGSAGEILAQYAAAQALAQVVLDSCARAKARAAPLLNDAAGSLRGRLTESITLLNRAQRACGELAQRVEGDMAALRDAASQRAHGARAKSTTDDLLHRLRRPQA